ncbi:MAG TPA: glutaminyl-peptide cyclotransferase, partial [Puia sp.]|nr:glutaminyl-peptide cyclotransferase [Puia sp.]
MIKKIIAPVSIIVILISCNNNTTATLNDSGSDNGPATLNFSVLNQYPHDTTSYTEGLLVHEGQLYESTGHTDGVPSSRSLFGPVDLKTGKINPKVEIGNKYFGEGIT